MIRDKFPSFLSLMGGETYIEFSADRNVFLGSEAKSLVNSRREHPLHISF